MSGGNVGVPDEKDHVAHLPEAQSAAALMQNAIIPQQKGADEEH